MKKNALVTGASGGIGYELALLLAKDNYNLVLISRNENRLQEIKIDFEKRFGISVLIISGDLSKPDFPEKIFEIVSQKRLFIEVLVNNAGLGDYGLFYNSDLRKQEEMIQLNILALTKLTRLFITEMIELKKGKILNLASVAGFLPGPFMSVYFATKAFVVSFSIALASELKNTGITVTTLCPGPTQSNFSKAASIEDSEVFNTKIPSSEVVACYGYKMLMRSKGVVIHGNANKANVFLSRFIPRGFLAGLIRKKQEAK